MLGQFKPVAYEPFGRRRSRWHLPPWLVLLLGGIAAGALGLAVVQERYLPPRLTADASTKLRNAFEQADAERQRLKTDLATTSAQLEKSLAEKKAMTEEYASSHAIVERARDDVSAVIAALPPDPRGGVVAVRAGSFTAKAGQLAYNVVLTRERAAGKPMTGVMQLLVTGLSARGAETTVTLKPVALAIGSQEVVRGSLALPEGFRPRQVSIQLLDREGGKLLGMRVLLVA